MSRILKAFTPLENKTITWTAAANSQAVTFTTQVQLGNGSVFLQGSSAYFPSSLKIDNQTGVSVFVAHKAGSDPTAATTDYEVNADSPPVIIDIGQDDHVAVIPGASATGSVYLSRGLGVS